ncbi:MAG: glucokinase [Deltaproteobacteria bacterium]|nr:glucokinase [Deltaproteobacteria bacterium]
MSRQGAIILAGDIGGTKTDLAIFSSETGLAAPMAEASFSSGDYPGLELIVREFLFRSGSDINIDQAVFGVSGPVIEGRAKITNLPWVMEEATIEKTLGLPSVHLFNDLIACAYAVPLLGTSDLCTLNKGIPDPQGSRAIVAPGTGLGEACLHWDGTGYLAYPSEGGHADFAPMNALEEALLHHLQQRFDHVSYERVCSGNGLFNIYHFLKDEGYAEEPAWLTKMLAGVDDPVPVIIGSALDAKRSCTLCLTTLNMFVSILGAEAGNTALKLMASGGVFLGGGILPHIISALQNGLLMNAFRQKGRMSGLMERIPVHVIMNPRAALLGAASRGMSLVCREDRQK